MASALSDGVWISGLGVLFAAMLASVGWLVRQMSRTASTLERIDERTLDHDARIRALENARERGRP